MRTSLRRTFSVAALAIVPVVAFAPVAAATATTVNYTCQGSTPLGNQTTTLTQGADVNAPATAVHGSDVTVVIDPAVNTVPTSANGFTVKSVKGLALKIPIPANSTYVSSSLSGGSANLGTVTIAVSGNVATLSATGTLNGGASFEFPTVTVHLTASGAVGSTIDTKLYGTSYTDPGLTFTATVSWALGTINIATKCYPSPNPVITTTTIT